MEKPFNGLTFNQLRSIFGGRTREDVWRNIQEQLDLQNSVLPDEMPTPGALLHVPPSDTRPAKVPKKRSTSHDR